MLQIGVPAESLMALESLRRHAFHSELHVSQIPPPARIAPQAVAFRAEISDSASLDPDSYRGNTRFVLLYDPEGQPAWDGTIRIVAYASAPVESNMGGSPLLDGVSWTWLAEFLETRGAEYHSLTEAVTQNYNETLTGMHMTDSTIDLEVRASWSPDYADISAHLDAWTDFTASVYGLSPDGVAALPRSSGAL